MLSASKLSTVAAGKEVITTPLGNKFGKPGIVGVGVGLKTDLKDGIGIGVGVSATSAAAAAAANDRVQNYLNTLQPNGTSLIDGPLRYTPTISRSIQ